MRALRLQNELLATTILLDKGADIYELVYRPRALNVLWKSRPSLKDPGRDVPTVFASEAAWLDAYPGGWQGIFPSGGGPCTYKGIELSFHGEASIAPWDYDVIHSDPDTVEIRLHTRLRRSPFFMERRLRLESGRPVMWLTERITNEAAEPMDYMWGHHPALGAPFLSGACRIDVGARTALVDDRYIGTANPLIPGARFAWPLAESDGHLLDMSRIPPGDVARDAYLYLTDFEAGWYAVTNSELEFGIGLAWPREVFPYLWLWQEMYASPGFPFYREAYTMALEPFTSIPGYGLTAAMAAGAHRTLSPGASVEADLAVVLYEGSEGVSFIGRNGAVERRSQ